MVIIIIIINILLLFDLNFYCSWNSKTLFNSCIQCKVTTLQASAYGWRTIKGGFEIAAGTRL